MLDDDIGNVELFIVQNTAQATLYSTFTSWFHNRKDFQVTIYSWIFTSAYLDGSLGSTTCLLHDAKGHDLVGLIIELYCHTILDIGCVYGYIEGGGGAGELVGGRSEGIGGGKETGEDGNRFHGVEGEGE